MPAAAPKLRNIGPKSAAWLRQVGLRTEADIVAIGPVEAYMRVRRAGFRPTLNLLYALEGLPDPWVARIAGTQAREYAPLKLDAPPPDRRIAVALED